jgi:hypothetical protein
MIGRASIRTRLEGWNDMDVEEGYYFAPLRGKKGSMPDLKEGQMGWCVDTQELFIGRHGKNLLLCCLKDK